MSELWAQVDLGLVDVQYPIALQGYSTTPVNDMANSLQTIDNHEYLLSLSTNTTYYYNTGQPNLVNGQGATQILSTTVQTGENFPQNIYYPLYPSVYAREATASDNISQLNSATANLLSYVGGFVNSVGPPFYRLVCPPS